MESVAPAPEQIVRLPCSPALSNPSLFHCRSNKRSKHFCIPKKFVCDGEFDCGDGSDEEGCDDSTRRFKRKVLNDSLVLKKKGWYNFHLSMRCFLTCLFIKTLFFISPLISYIKRVGVSTNENRRKFTRDRLIFGLIQTLVHAKKLFSIFGKFQF